MVLGLVRVAYAAVNFLMDETISPVRSCPADGISLFPPVPLDKSGITDRVECIKPAKNIGFWSSKVSGG
jgi:hypothetical protein